MKDPRLQVVGVITQPDAQRGRGRSVRPSPVAAVAEEHGLPVHKWSRLRNGGTHHAAHASQLLVPTGRETSRSADTASAGASNEMEYQPSQTQGSETPGEVLAQYAAHGVQAVAVVAYGNLIPAALLETFTHGWINLHFSLLPRWRGAAPVQAALAAGDHTTGVSIFRIEEGLDTGPVLATATHPITMRDTADDLLESLAEIGRVVLADSLVALGEGAATLHKQDHARATHAAKIQPRQAEIVWQQPADVIQRLSRAHTPAPGAWTMLGGQRYKLGLMLPVDEVHGGADHGTSEASGGAIYLEPGQLAMWNKRVLVGTGNGRPLEILRIQPPGKKMMDAADWARGQQHLLASGSRFEQSQPGLEAATADSAEPTADRVGTKSAAPTESTLPKGSAPAHLTNSAQRKG